MSAILFACVLCACVLSCAPGACACPDACVCGLDARGRRQVSCALGNMADPIPVAAMATDTEVLLIAAPDGKPNALTIGPIFARITNLEEVRIVHSRVPAIGHHSFRGATRMRILDLAHNHVTALFDYNFHGLGNLTTLRLSHNLIASAPSGSFRHLVELRELALNDNRLAQLEPRLFLKLARLRELDLGGNPLRTLDAQVFKDVQELHTLRLRGCGLRTVPGFLYHHLPELRLLDLGNNLLTELGAEDFRPLHHLRTLRLDGNQLAELPLRAFAATALHSLSVARNRLAAVPAHALDGLDQLAELDLGANLLVRFDAQALKPVAESLRSLRLAGNKMALTDLRSALASVLGVRSLDLSAMNLTDLPLDLLSLYDHVTRLNLSDNRLEHLPDRMRLRPTLLALDLSGNLLAGLPERLAIQMAALEEVWLSRNPWRCDRCHVLPLLSTRALPGLRDTKQVTCATPLELKHRPLDSLRRSELVECGARAGRANPNEPEAVPNVTLAALGACALMLLLAAAVGIACGCAMRKRIHAARYYTNEQRRSTAQPTSATGGDLGYKIMATEPEAC